MGHSVAFSEDPGEVLARAEGFLASRPVEHNVILTLLRGRLAYPEPGRYWILSEGEEVTGVVFQSPLDFPVTLTPMTPETAAAAAAAVAESGVDLPGVNAEAATAARFAGQWTELRKSAARPVDGQRIYRLGRLRPPSGVPGGLRRAEEADRSRLIELVQGFREDVGGDAPLDPEVLVERRVPAGEVWLWDDGGPVSLAAHTAGVEGVTRIQAVYTPPEKRHRGYAGACVAALSERLVAQGLQCILYTELSNPISNSVYRRIGYEAVLEVLRYRFEG